MSTVFVKSRAIVRNITTRAVRILGLNLNPGKSADLFKSVEGLTETDVVNSLSAPNGDLYREVAVKHTLVLEDLVLASFLNTPNEILVVNFLAVSGSSSALSVGFQLTASNSEAVTRPVLADLGVFDDPNLTIISETAFFNTSTTGTIESAENIAAIKVLTNSSGKFECNLNKLTSGTVYMALFSTYGGPIIESDSIKTVVFDI